jgi:hypothetical protein
LGQYLGQRGGQSGQHLLRRSVAGHHHGLLVQRGQEVGDQLLTGPGGGLAGDGGQPAAARGAQSGRPAEPGEQLQHDGGGHLRAEHPLQGGVDLGEQAADAVADPGGLGGLVVVEADQHAELGEYLLADVDPAQCVRHGAGGLGDDVGVAGVGFGRAGMQVGDPAHGQPGQVGDLAADLAGDRDRQRPDGGRLIYYDQDRPVDLQAGE